jgi:molybdenum cofactor cytidylyltransferase
VGGEAGRDGTRVSISAIVLAAGRSTRMGVQKLLLPLGGRPIVQWVVDAALASKAAETIVVVGHDGALVAEALKDRPVNAVANPDYAAGMSTSLRTGLLAMADDRDGAVILLGDQPFFTPGLLDVLIDRFAQTRKAVVRPSVGGRPANPVLMSSALFPEMLEQRGDVGGREVIARHLAEVCLVPVDDPGVVVDIDSIADYEAAKETM